MAKWLSHNRAFAALMAAPGAVASGEIVGFGGSFKDISTGGQEEPLTQSYN